MKAGVNLLYIGLLHGLHHQDRHLLRRGVFLCFTVPDGEGPAAVSHNEIVPILRLMMETVPGRLHLFPAHIRHMEGSPGRAYRLAGLPVIRRGLRGYIQNFLIPAGLLELLQFRRKIVLLGLPQVRQLFIQSRNAARHQVFIDFFLRCVFLRVLRRVLRIALPEKFIHVVGDIHCPLGQFFFRDIILEGHHPVFLRDTAGLAVIILMEGVPGIPDIAQIGKITALVHCHVPAVCLIVNVIPQMLRHLHGVQFLDVVPTQVVIVLDRRVQVIAVQVVRKVDDLLQAAGMVAHLHGRLKLRVLALAHFPQL